ncbi:Mu transposase C-terminal domain-containing protein [Salinispora arenicola]|uniref:Mu transposase C-terminal domain-containing protein n=1 Tax=Salinispora arenicola TaxID=168697 RepID=UPI00037DE6FE|nr:Mu transposase C-terminal domain-containing protein [Salinispora arenicola]
MPRPSVERWTAAVDQLRAQREAGQLTTAKVRTVAAGLGVSERSVWRRLAAPPPASSGFRLSETDRAAFVDFGGNVAAVHRARTAALVGKTSVAGAPIGDELVAGWTGADSVNLRTLQRAFAAELTPAQHAAARTGERGRRAKLVYLRRRASHRNQVWEGDHKNLPILVLLRRGRATTPWVTMFIDDATRLISGWAIALTPHAGTVLTALRMGMLPDDAGPSCGVPGMLRLDQGLEFAADAVMAAAGALGVEVHVLPPYRPNRKGKIERLNRSVEQMLLSMLPGFTGGAREVNGRLAGPLDDRARVRAGYGEAAAVEGSQLDPARVPMRWSVFVDRFAEWVTWYNTEHIHSGLGGRTPAAAWAADPTPLRTVPEKVLRHLLLADEERTINSDGIHFNTHVYGDPAGQVLERGGQKVQIRYMPHDDRFLHVYLDGKYLTTCYPVNALSDEQAEQYYAAARAAERAAAADKRAARRRGRRRLATLASAGEPAAEARLVSPAEAARAPGVDVEPRRSVSTSLLGIGPAVPLDGVEDHQW